MSSASLPRWSRWRCIVAPAALLAAALAAGCGSTPARPAKTIEVVATTPVSDEVLDYQDFTGRLDALFTVEMRARVSGYINEAPFKEGDPVKKGDLLFRIDPRSTKADLNQADANYKLALADRYLQELNSARALQLLGKRAMGREEFDQIMGAREKAKATVLATEAARERAAVYLEYTDVTAPRNGRISRRFVDPGNLVKADDTLLTTIVDDNKVYAYFDVDERTYLDLVGTRPSTSVASRLTGLKFPVLMRLANEEEYTHEGYVDFLDNRLNGNTGTIRMRGVFDNPYGIYKSGLFVRIRLPIGKPYQALLIPDEALQSDQGRKYVYVVKAVRETREDGTEEKADVVEYRAVKVGQSIRGLRVIKENLKKGERVIVEGMQRARPENRVQVTMRPAPKPPGSPLGRLLRNQGPGTRSQGPARTKAPDGRANARPRAAKRDDS